MYNIDTINERKIYKMYIVSKQYYCAEDGKEFESIDQCEKYEKNLLKKSTIECWDWTGEKIENFSKSKINSVGVIKLNSEEDKQIFNIFYEDEDVFCPKKINTFYMWDEERHRFMTSQEYEEIIEPSYFILKKLEAEN